MANVIGLVINMVLDPFLIFGFGPIPAMGAAGAAIATVGAQAVVTAVFLWFARRDTLVFSQVHILERTSRRYIRQIIKIGFPAGVQTMIYSGISMVLTRMVTDFGDTAIAVQKVGSQIESVAWMTADGFAAAINSFIGQNFGAGKTERVKGGYKKAAWIMAAWGLGSSALLIFGAEPVFRIFIHEPEVVADGIIYLQVLGLSQMFMCEEILTEGALAGLGKTMQASVISVIFTAARIPMALILSSTALGLSGIWWAITLTSVVKGIVFVSYFMAVMRKLPPEVEEKR